MCSSGDETNVNMIGEHFSYSIDNLDSFNAHFHLLNNDSVVKSTPPAEDWPLSISTADVRRILLRVNKSKTARPNNIHGLV